MFQCCDKCCSTIFRGQKVESDKNFIIFLPRVIGSKANVLAPVGKPESDEAKDFVN